MGSSCAEVTLYKTVSKVVLSVYRGHDHNESIERRHSIFFSSPFICEDIFPSQFFRFRGFFPISRRNLPLTTLSH